MCSFRFLPWSLSRYCSSYSDQHIGYAGKNTLIPFAKLHLPIGVATALCSTLQGDTLVVFPKMLLGIHDAKRSLLFLPDTGDIQQNVRLPPALLGLMRFEQKNGRSTDDRNCRLMAMGLRNDPGFLCGVRSKRMVEVVRVSDGVG